MKNHIKNLCGWKNKRKLIIFSVDDYGNIRLDSKQAKEEMERAGLKSQNRFDAYDSLETKEDLDALFGVLTSVKDKVGHSVIFTPYVLPCNINFEAMKEVGHSRYIYELLPVTYEKLSSNHPDAYEGAWKLWQEGIEKGIMAPQFHGREHFNLKIFEEKLASGDQELFTSLNERSLANISDSGYSSITWTAAFSFWELSELKRHEITLKEGLDAFEQVFGYRSLVFTPPAQQFHPDLYPVLKRNGIQAIDRPFFYKQHLGKGKNKRQWERLRYDRSVGLVKIVRNVVFEPTQGNIDHVGKALQQVEAAFRFNRPANISSHRVNFCGHIDPKNREKGLSALKTLLKKIVQRWPEVEFISAADLVKLIYKT